MLIGMTDITPVVLSILSILCCLAVLTSCFAFGMALNARIDVKAQKLSTHSIQYVPVDELGGIKADDDKTRRKIADEAPADTGGMLDLGQDAF